MMMIANEPFELDVWNMANLQIIYYKFNNKKYGDSAKF